MRETTRIFVGSKDGSELKDLGKKAKEEGAVTGPNTRSVLRQMSRRGLRPGAVSLEGGQLRACVPELTERFLKRGVAVDVDFRKCRVGPDDHGDNPDGPTLARRRAVLQKHLPETVLKKPFLTFFP